ncbi:MAG: tyrosine-type recombinase/integrase [Lentisphaeria bacterium]|nr:tyrosine-type recombinase/integrase [Lentisphaeria bacterium]
MKNSQNSVSLESGQDPFENDGFIAVSAAWLEWLAASGRRPKTVACRGEALKRFGEFLHSVGKERFRDVTKRDLENWRSAMFERGNSVATVEQRLRGVRLLFDWLDEQGLLFENPARKLKPHRVPDRLPVVPSVGEVFRLLATIDTSTPIGVRDRAVIETVYGAGLRLGEVTALTAGDFDWDFGLLRVNGKGGKQRSVPVGKRALKWAGVYVKTVRPLLLGKKPDPGCLWIGKDGGPLSSQGLSVRIRHWIRMAGLPRKYTPHALRRAAATHMLDNGASPFAIKEFLGHADMKHLSQYLRITIGGLKEMHQGSRPGQ